MVKDLPSNAGDTGSIPGWGIKSPHVVGGARVPQLERSPCITMEENLCMPQVRCCTAKNKQINILKK